MRLHLPAALLVVAAVRAQNAPAALPGSTPVPRVQAVPLPNDQIALESDGRELTRYHFGAALRRPFLFPVVGPSGRFLTRMGHPHDPVTHSHHNSVWIAHHDVNGVDFWSDAGSARIAHERIASLEDGADTATVVTEASWLDGAGAPLLRERRRTAVRVLAGGEWILLIDLELSPAHGPVTLGKTPFGMMAVRMARSIGVHDGGGRIRSSEGGENERQVLWKRARWVDYSGPVAPDTAEGITLLDHPSNPNHPSYFHVRDDGWMGASLTYDAPRTVDSTLHLRYALYVHSGVPTPAAIEARWREFAGK